MSTTNKNTELPYLIAKVVAYISTLCFFPLSDCFASLTSIGTAATSTGEAGTVASSINDNFTVARDLVLNVGTGPLVQLVAIVGFLFGIMLAGIKNSGVLAMGSIAWLLFLGMGPKMVSSVMGAIV